MEFKGKIENITRDLKGAYNVTISTKSNISSLQELQEETLDVEIKKHREKRSLNANALFWSCLNKIASAMRTDNWSVYLLMLKRYGQYTYICVKPDAVEGVKKQWRECEEIGDININGQKAVQLLCYYGSSTYNTQEFSVLLDGVISEMKELGLPTPEDEELERTLEQWENQS